MRGIDSRRGTRARRAANLLALGLVSILLGTACGSGRTAIRPAAPTPDPGLEFLGYVEIPPGNEPGHPLGGLSGLAWDEESETLYAISDNKGRYGPPRIYRLGLRIEPSATRVVDVEVRGWIPLTGWEADVRGLDPESLALSPEGDGFFVGSEGWIERGVRPMVGRFDREGRFRNALPLPDAFRMARDHGPRDNKVFESLTISPSGSHLFAATESGLVQDAPDGDWGRSSVVRILRWNLAENRWEDQVPYPTDPVHAPPMPAGSLRAAGLTDLLALDARTLLALERSFSMGSGFSVRVYRVDLSRAEDVTDRPGDLDALEERALARKTLLVDFQDLGIPVDNVEGLTFGPRLGDGRRSLLLVSDDNFDPDGQSTQLLLFGWED